MKPSAPIASLLTLFVPILSAAAIAHASSPADSVPFCAFDHEQWRRDRPRPAAKPLAGLDVGEPRTVRIIYFLPNDWSYRGDVVDSMKTVIKQSQTFYREQMQAHGYGDRTFRIETNAGGEPLVHRVDGRHPFSHYDNTLGTAVVSELEETFDLDANIYVIILGTDALRQDDGQAAGGVGRRRTKNGGALVVPNRFGFRIVAHELGHTFGLYHDFRDNRYLMSYGGDTRGVLSACAAEFLSVHAYFNPAVPVAEGQPPTAEITSPTIYQPGTPSVPVQLRVRDSEELHQVMLIGNAKPCRGLAGQREAVVDFNYDGSYSEHGFSPLSERSKHHLFIVAVDADGNVRENWFALTEISPYEIATLKGSLDFITSVAFSPDGALIAYAATSEDLYDNAAVVRLWDLETGQDIPLLDTRGVTYVAFSPDGTLASGDLDGVQLVDVATRKRITTLPGRSQMAFSRDGHLLASSAINYTEILLWDLTTGREIGTLTGHTDQVNAFAFSPDGTLLASGSGNGELGDDSVRLWDVANRREITRLEVPGYGVWSVAFSPDGNSPLAWGSALGGVTLWDVASQEETAFLEEGGPPVAFTPDGATLAYGSPGGAITLWDVGSRSELVTLAGEAPDANSLSISPDGTRLASGSWWGGTITLWDVSEWTGPRPFALEIVSGDGQRSAPGEALAQPLVVEVRDQYGNLLPDVAVTFAFTAGGGTLSVETATTDADGRAAATLTLWNQPGTITVQAAVAVLDPVTFTATAEATPDFDGDGEVGFSDFLLFAEAFGGSNPRFDLDGSGKVDFADFFLFAESFGQPARARLLALAGERLGLPAGPRLQQNAPNPFNSSTVISWFQLQPGPARLEVFALTGQRVAVLRERPQKAGFHRLRWDGRDDQGRALASGVYVYRLVTAGDVQTRMLTLLR